MGNVLLVQVEREALGSEPWPQVLPGGATLRQVGPEELPGAVAGGAAQALVLGAKLPHPLDLLRRARAEDPDLAVVVLTLPSRHAELGRALEGEESIVLCEPDPQALWDALGRAVARTRGRRKGGAASRAPPSGALPAEEVAKLGRLLDASPVGVSAVDLAGRVVAWNRRAQLLFERSFAQLQGLPFGGLLPAGTRARWESLLAQAPRLPGPTLLPLERMREGGELQHLELTATPLASGAGPAGLMLVFQDVTARVQAEQERDGLLRQAQHALAIRDEFLQVASHELRTPLTTLRLMIQALGRDLLQLSAPPAEREGLGLRIATADRQVVRLSRLVEGLLDVSSVQSGRLRLERSVVDLAQVVQASVAELSDALVGAGCKVDLCLGEGVRGAWDRDRLQQVATHLLSNAIRYAPGTTLTLTVGQQPGWAVLQVEDRGIGIDRANLERIFDRFERATPVRNYGGLGLGLYISKKIVEAHGGQIRVSSRPGEGATFRVELPLPQGGELAPQ